MNKFEKTSLFLLRVSLGWLFFYAGITKVLNSEWTSAGYLKGAKTFSVFYSWLSQPGIVSVVDFLNEWGLTLVGLSLILGFLVRVSSWGGFLLMILYYLPILDFPYPNTHSFIVDEHVIYGIIFLFFIAFRAGRTWGLDSWCARLPICSKYPRLRSLFG